ncbi:MAG: cytochrome c-type biogenesis protein CcmH [Proteobacteria bacterium]|nr:cytochrome c-type biogenesis protein CcmH [Pseudomonadota bacterium]
MIVRVLRTLALLAALLAPALAHAVQPSEILPDAKLESRARALSSELRCMVCQNQSIDDSDAPLARDLRLLVREQLVAGRSDGEIRDYLVARYGNFVLLRPPFNPGTALLWGLPFLVLIGGLLALALRARRQPGRAATADLDADEQARLDAILHEGERPPSP